MSAVIELLSEGTTGQAADTGSAVHEAARAWHREAKRDLAAALKAMREGLPRYPLADLGTAEEHFRHYAGDARNACEVEKCEEEVTLHLEAETGPVVIVGHVDQVRGDCVYDIKTGNAHDGPDMLLHACYQLAAYQCATGSARACIIRTRDYPMGRKRIPGPVFWYAPWKMAHARSMVGEVARRVDAIRRGKIDISASPEACRYCIAVGPQNCIERRNALCAT